MKAALISLGSVSSKWTAHAMKKYFDDVDELDIRKIEVTIQGGNLDVISDGKPIKKYDCIFAKGSFRYVSLLRALTSSLSRETYMPIQAQAFTLGHDKLLTQLEIYQSKIPMPRTFLAATTKAARKILENANYPIVMKFPQGTGGKGVMFADSFASASSLLDALTALKQPFIIQEYVETGGVDIRAIVVGNKVVAAMKRKAVLGEKRANIHTGGVGEAYQLDYHTKRIAIDTAKALGAEICGVDILESHAGPLVIEVNLSPGLQGITKATGIDVADKIAKYLYERTKSLVDTEKVNGTKKIMDDLGIESTSEVPKIKEIITNLDFRGERILLPEAVTFVSKLTEKGEVVIKSEKGKIEITSFAD